MVADRPFHVARCFQKDGWSVRRHLALRALRVFGTEQQAISYAEELAEKKKTVLYIHNDDATIRLKKSWRPIL